MYNVVVTRERMSVVGMKSIFRILCVNRSMARLDLLAVRGLFIFLEVSHGGLKLSHERLQRPEIRLNLRRASRLGNIWDMTFKALRGVRTYSAGDGCSRTRSAIAG